MMEETQRRMTETPFAVQWPGRIIFGAGKLAVLGEEAKALGGERALVVTTQDLVNLGVVERAERILRDAGLTATRLDDVQPDPTCEAVDRAAAAVRAAGVDLLVALGGGSAIDFAKALSAAATHDGPIWEYVTYTGAHARPLGASLLPLIAVPTTAGTGSEVSQGSVLDNPMLEMKAALLSPRMYPRVALVDPELTYTMPPSTTAMTGFDALTHGIESFLNVQRSNPASELFALEAVRRASANLPAVVQNGGDLHARTEMCWAATCGGLAIGLSNAAVAHAMALPLGARLGTPHGLALAALQPVVLDHTWEVQPERCAVLADAVGATAPGMDVREKARALAVWMHAFVERIGLRDIPLVRDGAPEAGAAARLADDVFAYMARPVSQYRPVFDHAEIRAMFEAVLDPARGRT